MTAATAETLRLGEALATMAREFLPVDGHETARLMVGAADRLPASAYSRCMRLEPYLAAQGKLVEQR